MEYLSEITPEKFTVAIAAVLAFWGGTWASFKDMSTLAKLLTGGLLFLVLVLLAVLL